MGLLDLAKAAGHIALAAKEFTNNPYEGVHHSIKAIVSIGDAIKDFGSSEEETDSSVSKLVDSEKIEATTQRIEGKAVKTKHRKGERNVNFQFLSDDASGFHLMDSETNEKIVVPKSKIIGHGAKYLKKGENIKVLLDDDTVVYAEVPDVVTLLVTDIDETDINVLDEKLATVETGAKVRVPKRIKIGDKIRVDTSIGSFERKARS